MSLLFNLHIIIATRFPWANFSVSQPFKCWGTPDKKGQQNLLSLEENWSTCEPGAIVGNPSDSGHTDF